MSYLTVSAKTRDDLDRSIREYKYDLLHRCVIQSAVCDVVEGVCYDSCVWTKIEGAGLTVFHGFYTSFNHLNIIHPRQKRPDVCPYCTRRVIERFEIIGGGVE